MIGFLLSQNQNLLMYALVMFHGYLIIARISGSQEGLSGIGAMIINVAPVKRHFQSVNARHNQLLQTKYDCEVYFGVLSIPLIFVGQSSLMGTLLYWQIMRIRYLSSYGC